METGSLLGYWKNISAENNSGFYNSTYLHFDNTKLLQWGYESASKICVISFKFEVKNDSIRTVLLPNPRQESTSYFLSTDEKLTLTFSNYETTWIRTSKQNFFESENKWIPEPECVRPDYIKILNLPVTEFHNDRATFYKSTPHKAANTQALWLVWEYSKEPFSSFHLDDFAYILSKGVIINYRDNEENTLLMGVASDGYTEATKLLLENGFDINAQNIYGKTALDYAVYKNRIETSEFLKERDAKLGSELP